MELFVDPNSLDTFLLELLIHYLKLQQRGKVKLIKLSHGAMKAKNLGQLKIVTPTLISHQGKILEQLRDILGCLIGILPQWESFFMGKSKEQRMEILEIRQHIKDKRATKKGIQKFMQNRTFVTSNHLTLGDLDLFTQLYDLVVEMTEEQKLQYSNLFRWYKHIQNLPEITQFLQKAKRFIVESPIPQVKFMPAKKNLEKEQKSTKQQTIKKNQQASENYKFQKSQELIKKYPQSQEGKKLVQINSQVEKKQEIKPVEKIDLSQKC